MLCFNSAGELWAGEHSSNAGIKQDTEVAAFFTAPTTDTEVAAKADTASVASEGTWALSQKKLDFVDFLLHFFKSMFHFLLVKTLFYTLKNIPRDGERLRVPVALAEDLDSQSSITEEPGNLRPSSGLRRHLARM